MKVHMQHRRLEESTQPASEIDRAKSEIDAYLLSARHSKLIYCEFLPSLGRTEKGLKEEKEMRWKTKKKKKNLFLALGSFLLRYFAAQSALWAEDAVTAMSGFLTPQHGCKFDRLLFCGRQSVGKYSFSTRPPLTCPIPFWQMSLLLVLFVFQPFANI